MQTSDIKQNNIETLDLNIIRVFAAVFEEQSATRAALRLSVKQSTVSQTLGRLRLLYQDPLFIRTGRGLQPTAFSRQIYPLMRESLDQFAASLTLKNGRLGLDGGRTVTVGMSDDFEMVAGQLLSDMARTACPSVRLRFRQTNAQLVNQMLMARQIDFAVTAGGLTSDGISSVSVGRGNYACLTDPEYFGEEELTPENYTAHDHLLVSREGYIGIVDEVLAEYGLRRRIRLSTSHFAAVPFLLKGTDAVCTIPRHAAKAIAALSELRYSESPFRFPDYAVTVSWRNYARRDALIGRLIDRTSEVLSSENIWKSSET